MAKTFDPSQLSPADQAAYAQWQQQLRQYVAANGGGVPAPITYALLKPDYIKDHPELQEGYDIVSGANLPPTVKDAVKGYHPVWGDAQGKGDAGMSKDSGLFNKWETWLQLGLAGAVGGVGAAGALGGAAGGGAGAASAGSGAAAVPALGGGATLAANLGGAGALGAGGAGTAAAAAATGGTLASTALPTSYVAPISGSAGISSAAEGIGAGAATPSIWDKLFGKTTADKVLTGVGLGANALGNLVQSNQASKATQAQVDAANKALALQSNIYQQQRADLAPYRNAGTSSLSALTYGLGLDPSKSADTTTPYFQQQAAQNTAAIPVQRSPTPTQAVPRGTISSLAGGTVNMISPDGRPALVPQNQVQAALQAGGRMA